MPANSALLRRNSSSDPDPYDTPHYDLWIGHLPDLSDATLLADSTADTSFAMSSLDDDESWYWTVRATDSNSGGRWASDTLGFSIYIPEPPSSFAMLAPDSGAVIEQDSVRLCWSRSIDADPDDLLTYTLSWEMGGMTTDSSLVDTTLLLTGMQDNRYYSWRVRVQDSQGHRVECEGYAAGRSFTTDFPEPPTRFSLIAPADGTVIDDAATFPLLFDWEPSSDPDPADSIGFRIELDSDPSFSNPTVYDAGQADSLEVASLPVQNWWWRVVATDLDGLEASSFEAFQLNVTLDLVEGLVAGLPEEFSIVRLYPNPFNPTLTAVVGLPRDAELTVALYNMMGQRVGDLADGPFEAGYHTLTFAGSQLASGSYFVRASSPGGWEAVKRVTLMK